MKYRGYEIKKVKGKRPYECEQLKLKANTLEDMVRMISKIDNAKAILIEDYLEAKRRLFQFYCNQIEGEIISNALNEIKKNHNLKNNKEALLFLIELYRVK